jgi:hypothetical protein
MRKRIPLLLWFITLAGCATNPVHRYAGHWVEGAPYSLFIDSHDGRTYLLYDQLPQEVESYMENQHHYPAMNSESGQEKAISLVMDGYPEVEKTYDPEGTPAGTELHIAKIISYGPAEPAFINARESSAPSPEGLSGSGTPDTH